MFTVYVAACAHWYRGVCKNLVLVQILESVIKFRWGALPEEQRQGIKNYISNLIIKLSSDDQTFRRQKVFLNKLNVILVQVLKQDWPHKWPTFVQDIVGASKTSETLCENSMQILKLLSEEVFDFSRGEMTQAKIKDLKNSLNSEFKLIHELCLFVLNASQKPDLIRATLGTLYAFLSWVPLGYVFESNLVEILLKLFPQPAFRNLALQCLTEVRVACSSAGPGLHKHQSCATYATCCDHQYAALVKTAARGARQLTCHVLMLVYYSASAVHLHQVVMPHITLWLSLGEEHSDPSGGGHYVVLHLACTLLHHKASVASRAYSIKLAHVLADW